MTDRTALAHAQRVAQPMPACEQILVQPVDVDVQSACTAAGRSHLGTARYLCAKVVIGA
jgi:molybdenum cofactor biosynthesis enzyme